MAVTQGINHLGLSVKNLDQTVRFFVDCLGWTESGRDESYPRSAVSDGVSRLTLWEVDHNLDVSDFHFRKNVGMHHLALAVASEKVLIDTSLKIKGYPGVEIEFMPELVGDGPRKHMIFFEPGGIRLELIWSGE